MSGSFLQSREWEEFQAALGRKVWRVDGILVIRHDLPGRFNYLYCPRPELVTSEWLLKIQNIAKEEKSIFLKVDPIEKIRISNFEFRNSNNIQPPKTTVLDLQKSEDELLRGMHEKTRYNIRLAERKGVIFGGGNIEIFWRLLEETAKRDGFFVHPRDHYEKLLAGRPENFYNELFLAEYRGEILAAAMVNFYGPSGAATYLHGGSSRNKKELMAPHLLHWRIIQEAKKRGFRHYDFWGIDEKKWPGLTRFKIGFGGSTVNFPSSIDIVYRPFMYAAHRTARELL